MIHIIAGGTYYPIRPHLSVGAGDVAGTTGKQLYQMFLDRDAQTTLHQTRMAGGWSLRTNDDIDDLLRRLCLEVTTRVIVMPVALCDYIPFDLSVASPLGTKQSVPIGRTFPRLKTREQDVLHLTLVPAEKIINKIKLSRPDICLVGFKTTTIEIPEIQKALAGELATKAKCDFVVSNDLLTLNNVLLTYQGDVLEEGMNRTKILQALVSEVCSVLERTT